MFIFICSIPLTYKYNLNIVLKSVVGLYLSLLFIVLVITPFLSYFKRAPLKIDAIIFHFIHDSCSEALLLVTVCLFQCCN